MLNEDTSMPTSAGVAVSPDRAAIQSQKDQANLFQNEGRLEDAERCWSAVLLQDDQEGEALCGLCYCLLSLGKIEKVPTLIRRMLQTNTIYDQPWLRLGSKLAELHCYTDAIAVLRSLTAGFPARADFWHHLGTAELGNRDAAAALASLRRASMLEPTSAAVWCNTVLALMALNRLPEALAASRRALAIEPASAAARFNMGAVLLAMGRLAEGFAAYEHRFALGTAPWFRQAVAALPWTGEPLAGRSILVIGEQGNGDHIQFARYVSDLSRQAAEVTFMLPKRLHRLMSSLGGAIKLTEVPEAGDQYDFQISLLSLPSRGGIDGDRVPAIVPYLAAEADRVAAWRTRIGDEGFRIGIAWEGTRYPGNNDLNRSFPLDALWPVAQIPGVRLFSLQMAGMTDQAAKLFPKISVETFDDFDVGEHAFLDTAALMMNVDLVITLDSSIAHLAGALARPTWLALCFAPEWRWQRDRLDSPWYPTMRLFRQSVLGDWDGVFQRMAEALAPMVSAAPRAPTSEADSSPASVLPLAPTSCGEILDKITILEIKVERLPPASADQAAFELRHLRAVALGFGTLNDGVETQLRRLRQINRELWDVEDALHAHEAEQDFESQFVLLARSVYRLNDERASSKRAINRLLNSAIHEQKSFG